MFRFFLLSALMFFIGYGIISFLSRIFRGSAQNYYSNQKRNNHSNYPPQEEKHFSKDIGEYVNYEEVKDDEKKR